MAQSTIHHGFTDVVFTAQYPVRLWGRDWANGEEITVGLVRNWDEEEGQGEGGPWGWAGYPSRLLADLAGDVVTGHTHYCTSCGHETEYSNDFDCELEADHDYGLCTVCQAAGVDPNVSV